MLRTSEAKCAKKRSFLTTDQGMTALRNAQRDLWGNTTLRLYRCNVCANLHIGNDRRP